MNSLALPPKHPNNNYEDNFQLTLKLIEERDKLKPLPIYKGPFAMFLRPLGPQPDQSKDNRTLPDWTGFE